MEIVLYNGFTKRINSTKRPTGEGLTVDVVLKDNTNRYAPTFTIADIPSIFGFNFVKWGSSYYYINDYIYNNVYNTWDLVCSIDVLATWKNAIQAMTAFVTYSTSNFDKDIPDSRLSGTENAQTSTSSASLLTEGLTFIVTAFSPQCYIGNGAVYLSKLGFVTLENFLVSKFKDETTTIWDMTVEQEKELRGVFNSVYSCTAVPFNWNTSGLNLNLAGMLTGASCGAAAESHSYSTTINIPKRFNDFRDHAQFMSMVLYLPGVGSVDINADDFYGKSSISIKLSVDGVTGQGKYIVGGIYSYNVNFGSPVAVSVGEGNAVGASVAMNNANAQMASGVAGFLTTGNPMGVLAGITANYNAQVASMQRTIGVVGSQGGLGIAKASPGTWTNVYLTCIYHTTNTEPESVASAIGRPLNKVVSLANLTGYCQCANASINTQAPDSLKAQINSYMNGGFYIE